MTQTNYTCHPGTTCTSAASCATAREPHFGPAQRPAAQTEREAFEAAMREKCGWHDGDFTHGEFGYFYSHAAMTWLGWQARASLSATQQATPEPVGVFDEFKGRPVLLKTAPMLKHGEPLYTRPTAAPAVPEGWTLERKSDNRVVLKSPAGEAWSWAAYSVGSGTSAEFMYQFLSAMLAAAQAKGDQA